MKIMKVALCQMMVSSSKEENIKKAVGMIAQAADGGADLAVLPEMFNCPYDNSYFREFSEAGTSGETMRGIKKAAKDNKIYVIAGSIPEACDNNVYNTSYVVDNNGQVINRHRKIHLFDIDIKNGITFKESDVLSAGEDITMIDTEFGIIGLGICYDIRFWELSCLMADKGADLLVFPAAFNMVTGPAHFELLIRSRALDNQVYTCAVSPARDESASYVAYGHSMIADPFGSIKKEAGTGEEIIYADINSAMIQEIRQQFSIREHKRKDLYEIISKKSDIRNSIYK